jgi:hypothetical protein
MTRKTVNLIDMIEEVNRRNRGSICCAEVRRGWNSLLEGFLYENDAYAGYGYLEAEQLEGTRAEGMLPGIIRDANGPGEHEFPDETRVVYYIHHRLRSKHSV